MLMMHRIPTALALVLAVGCRDDRPKAKDPCAKLSELPGRPASLKVDECTTQLAELAQKDAKQLACVEACIDSSKTWDDYDGCRDSCKRTKYEDKLEPHDVESVSPAAVCKGWKSLHDKNGREPVMPDAEVAACTTSLDAMKRDQPQRFACEFQCTLQKTVDYAELVRCKDECK